MLRIGRAACPPAHSFACPSACPPAVPSAALVRPRLALDRSLACALVLWLRRAAADRCHLYPPFSLSCCPFPLRQELFVEAFARSATAKAATRTGADGRPIVKYEDVYTARAADDNLIFLEGIVPQPTFVNKT